MRLKSKDLVHSCIFGLVDSYKSYVMVLGIAGIDKVVFGGCEVMVLNGKIFIFAIT